MKKANLFKILLLLLVIGVYSCKKDDSGSEEPVNTAPIIKAQSFNASEAATDAAVFGTITATDAEEDALSFSIKTNSNNLFKISNTGVISLAAGKSLDYETATSHTLTIAVSDGKLSANAAITINVVDVDENVAPVIAAQSFSVAENTTASNNNQLAVNKSSATDTNTAIGTVIATDADGDALTFSSTDTTFEITTDGALSLKTGKTLDYETTQSYTVAVEVSDGTLSATVDITINVTNVNEAPDFEENLGLDDIAEDIADTVDFITIEATDPEGDNITFSLTNDANGLFEINADGEISLAAGKSLDYETATSHTITVQISDGSLFSTEDLIIEVTDVNETTANNGFVTTWKTTTANESITIPADIRHNRLRYNYTVDWGDGTTSTNHAANATHSYNVAGTYTVEITGVFPTINFAGGGDKSKIQTIEQWGNIEWKIMENSFLGCNNLTYNASDAPNLSTPPFMKMGRMFSEATSFNGDLSNWDVSNVADMNGMFRDAINFNGDISSWDVGKVVNMNGMFNGAEKFNQDIGNWNISNVTSMVAVFKDAKNFNQDISSWNVSSVDSMHQMFFRADNFNQNISSWDVSSVKDMRNMFYFATSFSQNLSGWNTINVTNCHSFGAASGLTTAQFPTQGACF